MHLTWVNFIHIYQPPTQDQEIIDKVARESYKEIAKILKKHPSLKWTVNITGCLASRLAETGHQDVIDEFKKLADKGQVEFTGSAAFHPILPLLSTQEIRRQIKINNEINKNLWGETYKPVGFYLPEMAYSRKVAKIIKEAGFKWIILDEIALGGRFGNINTNTKYIIKDIGLNVVFRNRALSKTFVPSSLLMILKEDRRAKTVITATDGELYGHHHKDWKNKIDALMGNDKISTLTISEYLSGLKRETKVLLKKSTWESSEEEIANDNFYSLWDDPANKIHAKLWQLADMAVKINGKHQHDPKHFISRLHLEKGIASCTFWWCSAKHPSPFCPTTWHPDEIEKGLENLIKSIRSLEELAVADKQAAEKIYLSIKKMIWKEHWEKHSNN